MYTSIIVLISSIMFGIALLLVSFKINKKEELLKKEKAIAKVDNIMHHDLCVNSLKNSHLVYQLYNKPDWYFMEDIIFKSSFIAHKVAEAGWVDEIIKMDNRSKLRITIKIEEIKDEDSKN